MKLLFYSLAFFLNLLISYRLFAVEQEHSQVDSHSSMCALSFVFPLTKAAYNNCCIGCDKPGLGASNHDPSQNSIQDCAFCCSPLTFVIDLITYPFRLCYFGGLIERRVGCSDIPVTSTNKKKVQVRDGDIED